MLRFHQSFVCIFQTYQRTIWCVAYLNHINQSLPINKSINQSINWSQSLLQVLSTTSKQMFGIRVAKDVDYLHTTTFMTLCAFNTVCISVKEVLSVCNSSTSYYNWEISLLVIFHQLVRVNRLISNELCVIPSWIPWNLQPDIRKKLIHALHERDWHTHLT